MATLHLVCGLPGSGKSTFAKKLEGEYPSLRLTPDEWMTRLYGEGFDTEKRSTVESIQWEIGQKALSLGVDVILEFGFWSKDERDNFRRRATELGATTKIHFLDVSREELWRRLSERNEHLPPHTFKVTEAQLDEWVARFETPIQEELIWSPENL
jgi:predicted kinase